MPVAVLPFELRKNKGGVVAAESEGVGHEVFYIRKFRRFGDDIEIDLGVLFEEVD